MNAEESKPTLNIDGNTYEFKEYEKDQKIITGTIMPVVDAATEVDAANSNGYAVDPNAKNGGRRKSRKPKKGGKRKTSKKAKKGSKKSKK